MRFAVISDMHFGDPECILVEQTGGEWRLKDGVVERLGWMQGLDVLVLLGDIFDFSIAEYNEAFAAAKPFFDWLSKDKKVSQIVYCPGNHDAMMWHVLECDTRITRPLGNGQERVAKTLRSTLPCLIDTTKPKDWVSLLGIHKPGDMFLSRFLGIPTCVGYPNVYVRLPTETMLLTHAHYLETFWAVSAELSEVLGSDDDKTHPELDLPPILDPPTLKQLVDFNHPLVSLACMGIGQAGDLTRRVRRIQKEGKHGPITKAMLLDKYLTRLRQEAANLLHGSYPKEPAARGKWDLLGRAKDATAHKAACLKVDLKNKAIDVGLDYGFEYLRGQINGIQPARVTSKTPAFQCWLDHPDVKPRLVRYLQAAQTEVKALGIPAPTAFVYGHTHTHEAWPTMVTVGDQPYRCCNTGGWLSEDEAYVLLGDESLSLRKALD